MIVLAVAALMQTAPTPGRTEPERAELCHAHINAFIAEEAEATGRVAGPSWFIRDWWSARLPEPGTPGALTDAQRREREANMPARKTADPDGFRAEQKACITEAIDAGAVPGMGPG